MYAEDTYLEIYHRAEADIIQQALHAKPGDRFHYTRIPFQLLRSVWESFMRMGMVLKPSLVDRIQEIMLYNTCILSIMTEGMGHSTHWPWNSWQDSFELSAQDMDKIKAVFLEWDYLDWAIFSNGQPLLSDHGLKPLNALLMELLSTQDYVQKIVLIDRMLNVVHCRSDLAELYVEGGSASLSRLSANPSEMTINI